MIVSCPNCFLEQPIDDFCPRCGKPLKKLLKEKAELTSKKIQLTNYILIGLTLFLLAGYSLYFIFNTQKKTPRKLVQKNLKVVSLNSLKIKKASLNKKITETVFPDPIEKNKITIEKKPLKEQKLQKDINLSINDIKKLYLLQEESCMDDVTAGTKLDPILQCSETLFSIENFHKDSILEEKDLYIFSTLIKVEKLKLIIKYKIETSESLFEIQDLHNLKLSSKIKNERDFQIWPVIKSLDLLDVQEPKSLLNNKILKNLADFSTQPASGKKLFYLVSYKKL